MASKASLLIAGVDTLIVNMKMPGVVEMSEDGTQERVHPSTLSADMEELLHLWLERAQNTHEPYVTSWMHEDITFKMHPKGTNTYRYLLRNSLIDVMIGPLLHNNALARVRFSSEYLWRAGPEAALVNTHAFLWSLFNEQVDLQCAEIHLCVDVADFVIPKEYEKLFVSRAATYRPIKASQLDRSVYRYRELETLQFSGHGNPISATIYNKVAEIQQKSPEKSWFYALWEKKGWNGMSPVRRIECRIKREALHEMNIEDAYEALARIPALWAYCVGHADQKDG